MAGGFSKRLPWLAHIPHKWRKEEMIRRGLESLADESFYRDVILKAKQRPVRRNVARRRTLKSRP